MDTGLFKKISVVADFMDGSDHIDVKTVDGTAALRDFVAGILSYQPGWMAVLWRIRVWLIAVLGQGQDPVPGKTSLTGKTLPVEPGNSAAFFTVAGSDGETYWVANIEDSHLDAMIAVVCEPLDDPHNLTRFHVATIVQYRNWAGPIYFNIIRPFHHLVVVFAMRWAAHVTENGRNDQAGR